MEAHINALDGWYIAVCECGWNAQAVASPVIAIGYANDHCSAMAHQPGVDVGMLQRGDVAAFERASRIRAAMNS
jgi:hypothetical protein